MPVRPVHLEILPEQPSTVAPAGELDVFIPGPADHTIELSRSERIVLLFDSLGKTAALNCTPEDLTTTRFSLVEKFEVPNMAAVVNHAILKRILTLRQDQAPIIDLTPRDFVLLQTFAAGGSNGEVSQVLQERSRNKIVTLNRRLFKKMGAWGRENSVRSAYERGAFKLGVSPITLDQILRENQE